MGPRRFLIAALALGAAAVVGWVAAPRRFVVEGVSMAPALLPGDVVRTGLFPAFDRLRRPRRFERWVIAAADGLAIKRVVGLPGEEVSIVDGDLTIDGVLMVKGPRLLAATGCSVPDESGAAPAPADADWAWSRPAGEILDEAPFDAGATRVLTAVRDVGLTAIVDVGRASTADPAEIRVRVASAVVSRQLTEPGRHAVVAGRLDGRLVITTWRVPTAAGPTSPRSCLPVGSPEAWQVADPWPGPADDGTAPALAIRGNDRVSFAEIGRWRDVAWRPAADGRSAWRLDADEVFVLGDHPAASTDSRRWGPTRTAALRHRVDAR